MFLPRLFQLDGSEKLSSGHAQFPRLASQQSISTKPLLTSFNHVRRSSTSTSTTDLCQMCDTISRFKTLPHMQKRLILQPRLQESGCQSTQDCLCQGGAGIYEDGGYQDGEQGAAEE